MYIKELILWSSTNNDYVAYYFKPGVINYITGPEACGKTTFLKIISYLLGCGESRIDADIESAVHWVGIRLVDNANIEHIFARKTEAGAKKNSKHCFHRIITTHTPFKYTESLTPYISPETMSEIWARLLDLDKIPREDNSENPPISPQAILALSIQGYDIIANEEILFDVNSNEDTGKLLRQNISYILGYESPETRILKSNHAKLQREVVAETKEISAINNVQSGWLGDLSSDLQKAAEFGLYEPSDLPLESQIDVIREGRKFIAQNGESGVARLPGLNTDSINVSTNIITNLESEVMQLLIQAKDDQERFEAIQSLREKMRLFKQHGQETMDRLELVEWLSKAWDLGQMELIPSVGETELAKCQTNTDAFKQALEEYRLSVANPDIQIDEDEQWRIQADAVIRHLRETQGKIDELQKTIGKLRTKHAEDANAHDTRIEAIGLVERIRLTMRMVDSLQLETKSAQLQQKKIQLENTKSQLDHQKSQDTKRKNETQHFLASATERLVEKQLGVGTAWTSYPEFDIKKLDLELHDGTRKVLLGKIGAATNHRAFHIAFTAAIQELARLLPNKHIFPFATFDISGQDDKGLGYSALENSLLESKHSWQPIVVDKLPSSGNLPADNEFYHRVALFSEGEGICPKHWFPHA